MMHLRHIEELASICCPQSWLWHVVEILVRKSAFQIMRLRHYPLGVLSSAKDEVRTNNLYTNNPL